ncbi:MAG: Holliday junction branch migration protein RuvA [Anaerolineae bacterium]
MIASIHGVLESIRGNILVVRVGGVGLQVLVPTSVISTYGTPGHEIDLLTHLIVREDALTLYGFKREEERHVFEALLGVSGIGPRMALAVLNTLSPEMVANAVHAEEAELLARVPGVGKKTAQKIVLDLKGKLLLGPSEEGIAAISSIDTDVLEVLTAMGFSIAEGQAAIQSIPPDAPDDIEERVRLALTYFAR